MRYISEYTDIDLEQCIRFTFSFGMENVKSDSYTFRSEFRLDDFKIILNLSSKIPVIKQSSVDSIIAVTSTSLIDIDVMLEDLQESSLTKLMDKI